jgi:hypothetical protein
MRSEEVFMSRFVLEKCYEERTSSPMSVLYTPRKEKESMETSRNDKNTEDYLAPQKNENIVTYKLLA